MSAIPVTSCQASSGCPAADKVRPNAPADACGSRSRHQLGQSGLLLTILLAGLLPAGPARALPPGFVDETVVGGISPPVAFAFAPDGRLVVTGDNGTASIVTNGVLQPTPFATLSIDGTNERGLNGVVFDPNFASNRFVYFYYTVPDGTLPAHNRIARFTVSGEAVVPGSAVTILDLDDLKGATHHMGGAMAFGRDGKLYVAVGDGTSSSNVQRLTNRFGKVLRINADGSIPADNPTSFPNIAGTTVGANRAIWAVGVRNPFTLAFHPQNGTLFINDVGELNFEEIDRGGRGRNYGWPDAEGPTSASGFTSPVYAYAHATGSPRGCAITGGAFYSPDRVNFPPFYVGKYFFTDFCGNWIYFIDPARPGVATLFQSELSSPVGLAVGNDGALYYAQRGNRQIRRIRYTGETVQRILVSSEDVDVAEGGTASVSVRLAAVPPASVTLTVRRTLSDYLITTAPTTMTFTPTNWDQPRPLAISAGADRDATDEGARFELAAPGMPTVVVRATAVDDDRPAGAPRAVISSPRAGDTVSGTTAEFFGEGRGGGTLTRAEFYIDGVLADTDPKNPSGHFHFNGDHSRWNTTLLANGNHTLRMAVYNGQGLSGAYMIRVKVAN